MSKCKNLHFHSFVKIYLVFTVHTMCLSYQRFKCGRLFCRTHFQLLRRITRVFLWSRGKFLDFLNEKGNLCDFNGFWAPKFWRKKCCISGGYRVSWNAQSVYLYTPFCWKISWRIFKVENFIVRLWSYTISNNLSFGACFFSFL